MTTTLPTQEAIRQPESGVAVRSSDMLASIAQRHYDHLVMRLILETSLPANVCRKLASYSAEEMVMVLRDTPELPMLANEKVSEAGPLTHD